MTARPNRSQEALEFLTGYYEVTNRDEKLGFISLSLWLCKPMGSASVPMDGLRFMARKDGETREIKPERLDVSGDRASKKNAILGMRLPIDALPKAWVGECEIAIGTYRSFPFKGVPDISKSLRPESRPPARERPAEEAVL